MRRTRGVRVFVVVARVGDEPNRLIGVANVDSLRWALAKQQPWLEVAWLSACAAMFPDSPVGPYVSPAVTTAEGALEGWKAVGILDDFKRRLQQPSIPPPEDPENWVELTGVRERATYVTPEFMRSLLPSLLEQVPVDIPIDAPQGRRASAVLRRKGQDWVALIDGRGTFRGLTNRRLLLEELAENVVKASNPD
jgi:hypothetical protein